MNATKKLALRAIMFECQKQKLRRASRSHELGKFDEVVFAIVYVMPKSLFRASRDKNMVRHMSLQARFCARDAPVFTIWPRNSQAYNLLARSSR